MRIVIANSCSKIPHPSESGAIAQAEQLAKRFGYQARAYYCHECKAWHAGSAENNHKRRLRRSF